MSPKKTEKLDLGRLERSPIHTCKVQYDVSKKGFVVKRFIV